MGDTVPFSVLNESLRPRWEDAPEDRRPGPPPPGSEAPPPVDPDQQDPAVTGTGPEEAGDDSERGSWWSLGDGEGADNADLLSVLAQCLHPVAADTRNGGSGMEVTQDPDGEKAVGPAGPRPGPGPGDGPSLGPGDGPGEGGDGGSFQRSDLDRSLPDLIRSGRPLGRRRTLGPVSDALNEVRREVELSRKRSVRLKAQVDKLQENSEGAGWSQHRERVTEEVLSILRLLRPLTDTDPGSEEKDPAPVLVLDAALQQLQSAARQLVIHHTKQSSGGGATEAVLQQALRDRDDAIHRKKGMEDELLRSKTEMMSLNNQLLEAVQKRLELSLELEAWKEDLQFILQQQIQSQHQAELLSQNSERKTAAPIRLGLTRRTNKLPIQRPAAYTPNAPSTNSHQIFIPKPSSPPAHSGGTMPPTAPQRNWRDRLRRGKIGRHGDQDQDQDQHPASAKDTDGFQSVSLD